MKYSLEASYKVYLAEDSIRTRLGFLSEAVFGFVTYEYEFLKSFSVQALWVCEGISNRKTYDLIEHDEYTYLAMVNMPFFVNKIEWGTSIRGAWWVYEPITLESAYLFDESYDQAAEITFSRKEWLKFIDDMIDFVKGDIVL